MIFEIFSYWNMRELELVFNAIAAIVGSNDYIGLLRTFVLVGLLALAMSVLAGFSQLPDFGRWIIMLAIFNGMLLVPKVTVVLVDRTGTQAPRSVANVPIGLAAFAHSVSHVGDYLTRTFETTFSLPNDIQFRTNGTLFGHRVQQEILHTKFDSSILSSNLLEFYRECVAPEFATDFIIASEMAKSNDIWTYLSGKTNPGRLVTIRTVPGATPVGNTYGCDVAYGHLGTQITYVNTQQMNGIGKRMYPSLPTAAANAAVQSSIQTSTNYMLGISSSAMNITRQAAMSNFMIDAQYMLPAQIGDAASAATNLAQAQAIRSTSESYKLMAKLAESTMPKIKNIIEVVQYSIFPIIMIFILMAGHKGGVVLKAYVMSLVWVQLWPPLYAIMHMVITIHSQELASMTSGLGLSMAAYSQVNNAYISDAAIAGMIAATAIPLIASAIVKGGDVGASALSSAISSPSQQATQAGSAMAQGNISMGNASLGNQSASNLSMGQVNTRATQTYGGAQITGADNVQHNFDGKGGHIINNSAAFQNIGMNLKASGRTAGALTKSAEQMETAALAQMTSAGSSMTAAKNKFGAFEKNHGKVTRSGETTATGSTAQYLKSYGEEQSLANTVAKEHGLNQAQMAQVSALARVSASGGLETPIGGVKTSGVAETKGTSSSATSQNQKLANQLANTKGYKEAVTSMDTASKSKDFARGEDAGSKAAQGIRSSLDESRAHTESASANLTKANSFKEAATRTTENAAGFEANANNQFMNWMTGQPNITSGKNFTHSEVEQVSRRGDLGDFAQKFTDQVLVPEIESKMPAPSNNIGVQHDANKATVPGTDSVANANNASQSAVATQQGKAGVVIGQNPKDTVSWTVKNSLDGANSETGKGKAGIESEGRPFKQAITENTDPARQNNIALASQNAAASVLPAGTMKLMDAIGGVSSDSGVAKSAVDNYKGTLGDAAVDTAIFVGTTAAGGVAGRGVASKADELIGIAKKSGDAAAATVKKIAANTEGRAAAQGLNKEIAATGTHAAQATTKMAADKAGGKAELVAQQTVAGLGIVGGSITGGAIANQFTGKQGASNQPIAQPAIEAVKNTDASVKDIVFDAVNEVKETLNQITKK